MPTDTRAAPPGWGTQPEMSAFETMMWRVDGIVRSPVLVLERFATAPDWDRLVDVHDRAVRALPRLRQRVVEPPLGLGAPNWSADPDFELTERLRRLQVSGGWSELLELAARWVLRPFPRAHPPWAAMLVEGLPGGEAAYLLKMHHAMTDGLGAAQLLERMHTGTAEPAGPAEPPAPPVPAPITTGIGALIGQFRRDAASVAGTVEAVGMGSLRAAGDPVGWLSSAARFGGSLRRTLGPIEAGRSPLLAGRGLPWRFGTLDVPLAQFRAAARVARGTLNDAYLAALLGGYRLYHGALGAEVDAIPMAVPVSLRRPGDPGGGNRIAGVRFAGPVGIADPALRVRAVRELVLAGRGEPAIDTLGLISPALGRLPGPVIARLIGPMTAANDLQASYLPGPRGERYLAGARVRRIYPFAPLPGCPAMITMVGQGDVGCVGVNLDPASITRPELFLECLRDGFTEVLALQPDPVEAVVPR